jgi:hypothetical protein
VAKFEEWKWLEAQQMLNERGGMTDVADVPAA